jgi:hypothetical protein
MEVNITFFQVTATAIPTLLVALAFTSKSLISDEGASGHLVPKSVPELAELLIVLTFVSTAEMLSLAAIATNKSHGFIVMIVGLVVIMLLAAIIGTAINGVAARFEKELSFKMVALSMVCAVIPFMTFFWYLAIAPTV